MQFQKLFDFGAGGKKSKKKLDKLGFSPQITSKKMPHIAEAISEVELEKIIAPVVK